VEIVRHYPISKAPLTSRKWWCRWEAVRGIVLRRMELLVPKFL
jgi:hypothetical protein